MEFGRMGLSALFMMSLISEWMRICSYVAITNTTEKLSADAKHDPLTRLLNGAAWKRKRRA